MTKIPSEFTLIAGPCSAESEEQLLKVASYLVSLQQEGLPVFALRAGVWKPRTRPGGFEGYGEPAIAWLKAVKDRFPSLAVMTEVARASHVEACLKAGIQTLWVGARTSSNPFAVQEIADAMSGTSLKIWVKNPMSPDLGLWMGAIERLERVGLSVVAIHRGFGLYNTQPYRNAPLWELPIELKRRCPSLPILCDPSHISGQADRVAEISQRAIDLEMDGLMIEIHPEPKLALSDASQQITPASLKELLLGLQFRNQHSLSAHLDTLRHLVDENDRELLSVLAHRFDLVKQMGLIKKQENLSVLQLTRWKIVLEQRAIWGKEMGMDEEFVRTLFRCIHSESVDLQK